MAQEHLQDLDDAVSTKLRSRSHSAGVASRHPVQGRTILIVEDNAEYRCLVKTLLTSRCSFRVIEAGDGQSALTKVRLERPDLVILDFEIPKMNGYEVLQDIRRNAETHGLPVIMLTGSSKRRHLKDMSMDVADFLEKPISGKELIDSITKALETAYGQPESEAAANRGAEAPTRRAIDYQEVLRMQEEFLSELGHDLRAPLTSISCALRLLMEKTGAGFNPDEKEFLDICLRNSQRLEALVRDIFDFRRRSLRRFLPASAGPQG